MEHIEEFQKLNIRVKDIPKEQERSNEEDILQEQSLD